MNDGDVDRSVSESTTASDGWVPDLSDGVPLSKGPWAQRQAQFKGLASVWNVELGFGSLIVKGPQPTHEVTYGIFILVSMLDRGTRTRRSLIETQCLGPRPPLNVG